MRCRSTWVGCIYRGKSRRRSVGVIGLESGMVKLAIMRNGYSEKQGARRMRNAAREAVQEAVRDALLSGREAGGRLDFKSNHKAVFFNGKKALVGPFWWWGFGRHPRSGAFWGVGQSGEAGPC